jgi:hypothetical protein
MSGKSIAQVQKGPVVAGSVRELDEAMQKLRAKLQKPSPGGSSIVPATADEPRPTTAQLSQQAAAILQHIDDFDLFAHVQKKVSTPTPPPRTSNNKPRTNNDNVGGNSIVGSGDSKFIAEKSGSASEGCGSSEPIPDDAPLMSDAVMHDGGAGQIGVDDHGHPGTVYRIVSVPPAKKTITPEGTAADSLAQPLLWRPAPHFLDSLKNGRTFVYFDFLLHCIRREQ